MFQAKVCLINWAPYRIENDKTGTPVENQSEGSLPFSTRRVLSMCYVQLDLVGTVKRLTDEYWSDLDDRDVLHLLKMLKDISVFAKQFNDNIRHRVKLMNLGFMRKIRNETNQAQVLGRPPSLLNQESQASILYIQLLFRIVSSAEIERFPFDVDVELQTSCTDFMESYRSCQMQTLLVWKPRQLNAARN